MKQLIPGVLSGLVVLVLAGCSGQLPRTAAVDTPETLTIFPDGSMRLGKRLIPAEDVFIYADGYGGEKAAVKVRIEPLHPNFYRDSIIVHRISGETLVTDN